MPFERRFSTLDRIVMEVDHALRTSLALAPLPTRPSPSSSHVAPALSDTARRHVVGLMRINHSGEVCAQALYLGQAIVAETRQLRAHLLHAAAEESDHLAWCAQRLESLHGVPSLFNPFWYLGSYVIGVVAGLAGDGYNLGFVVETERQVEAHLNDHLTSLPKEDTASRAILAEMMADEARHAEQADAAGARTLPRPVPVLMAACSQLMKWVAYRI